MKPLVLNNVVLEEVIVDFVQRVAVRQMDGDTVSEHQVGQLDAVNEDDSAVTVPGSSLLQLWFGINSTVRFYAPISLVRPEGGRLICPAT